VIVVVLVVIIAILATLGSTLFSVNSVDVAGRRFADERLVQEVVDDVRNEAVLLVDTDAAETRLEAIPFVASARVRTEFPNTVRIELRERVPVATTQGSDGRFRILDGEGRVLDVIGGQPVAFVLIEGPDPLDAEPGAFAPTGFAAAGAMVTKFTPEIRSRLVSISTTADGSDLRLRLRNEPFDDVEVRLGAAISDTDQFERLVRLQLLLDDVAGRDTSVIDVSTAEATER
jgi:cell division protein FtsQ